MRVLLIGGSGFIGPHVVAALRRDGHDVSVFHRTRSASSDIVGDRRDIAASSNALRALSPDVVVDLILSSGTQARELMAVFRGLAGRVVALSSCDVYRACGVLHRSEGGPLQGLPLVESSELRTNLQTYPPAHVKRLKAVFGWLDDDYDKISVEREIMGDRGLPGTVLRLPMVYGPGDRLHRVGSLLKRMDAETTITFEEKQAAWRGPRGYVGNVAAAIALAAASDSAAGRIYNVAEPECLSEWEWTKLVAEQVGWTGRVVTVRSDQAPELLSSANLDQHWVVDSTRIRTELGYREPISRDEALRRTVEWERTTTAALAS